MKLLVGVIILNLAIFVSAGVRLPCPSILKQVEDPYTGSSYGIITIHLPPAFANKVRDLHLQVNLSNYDVHVPKYLGNIKLLKSEDEAYYDLTHGQPLLYKFTFPSTNNFYLTSITLNGRPYCQENTYLNDPFTVICLDHDFVLQHVNNDHGLNDYDVHHDNNYDTYYSGLNSICGKPIFNGNNLLSQNNQVLEANNWPWLASISYNTNKDKLEYLCAGTLITTRHVLTASSCIKSKGSSTSPDKLFISLGISDNYPHDQDSFKKIRNYRIYDSLLSDKSTLAIIELQEDVKITPNVQPICILTDKNKDIIDESGYVVAWSRNDIGVIDPFELRLTKFTIKHKDDCLAYNELFKLPFSSIFTKKFCAGENKNNHYCTGNIGSGFVVYDYVNKMFFLRGVLSEFVAKHKTSSCHSPQYAEFIDVPEFIEWIEDKTL